MKEPVYKSLIGLMGEKELKDITASELALAAGVTEEAFVTEFKDVENCCRSAQEDLLTGLMEAIYKLREAGVKDYWENIYPVTMKYFKDYRTAFRVFFTSDGTSDFYNRYVESINKVYAENTSEYYPEGSNIDSWDSIVSGNVNIRHEMLVDWIKDDCTTPLETVIAILENSDKFLDNLYKELINYVESQKDDDDEEE